MNKRHLAASLTNDAKVVLRNLTAPSRDRLRALANDALQSIGKGPRYSEALGEQWRRVLRASKSRLDEMPMATGPRVMLAAVWGAHTAAPLIDATILMALRLRGAHTTVLACDAVLPACEWNRFGNHELDPTPFGPVTTRITRGETCASCTHMLGSSHTLPGFHWARFSDVKNDDDLAQATRVADATDYSAYRDLVYKDVHVGEHAYSSLMRTLLRGTPEDNPETRALFRRYLIAAILVVEYGDRLFARHRPDRLLAVHGVYVTQGTLTELARKRGIHVVVYGTPYRKGTIWLCHDDTYHRALVTHPNDRWESIEMTPARAKTAEEYLESKHLVPRDYISYHVDSIQDEDSIRRELALDNRPIVALYTNVLWDSQLYYRFNAFPNMLDWVYETIRYFEGRPELQLVIRLHPAETRGTLPTNQPLLPEIQREFPELPQNVRVVAPENRVSSYSLGKMSSAALIYGARIGVELAVLGTPVIVAGETFIRGKGFSLDATSREQYRAFLDCIPSLPRNSEATIARAKKWYYYYFFRLMMPFPFYSVDNVVHMSNPRLQLSHLDELLPGRSAVLDRVCQGILDGVSPFEYDELEAQ